MASRTTAAISTATLILERPAARTRALHRQLPISNRTRQQLVHMPLKLVHIRHLVSMAQVLRQEDNTVKPSQPTDNSSRTVNRLQATNKVPLVRT